MSGPNLAPGETNIARIVAAIRYLLWWAFNDAAITVGAYQDISNLYIPQVVQSIRTLGYYTKGDGGVATYQRVASQPSHQGKKRSADGTWWELAEDRPNLRQLGAQGGVNDDTAPMEHLGEYCNAKNFRHLQIPGGTWNMHAVLPYSGLTIEGDSVNNTTLANNSATGAALTVGDGTNTYNNTIIRDIAFAQKSGVATSGANKALWLRKLSNVTLDNVFTLQFPAAPQDGIVANGCFQFIFRDCTIDHASRDGLTVTDSQNVFGWDSEITVCGRNGVALIDNAGVHMHRIESIQNFKGWVITTQGGLVQQDHFFEQCLGDGSVSDNWEIGKLATARFLGCWFCTNKDLTTNKNARGLWLYGSGSCNLHFIGCAFNHNNGSGVLIQDIGTGMPDEIYFTGCEFGNNDPTPTLHGNGQGTGTTEGYGLEVVNSTSRIVVRGGVAMNNLLTPQIQLNTSQTKTIVEGVVGYNPLGASAVAVGASPFTFTAGSTRTTLFIFGGTVSDITIDGTSVLNATGFAVPLEPHQVCVVTYTVAPFITKTIA